MENFYSDPDINSYGYNENAEECDSEDFFSLARKTEDIVTKKKSYWVKICRSGFMSGSIFDSSTTSSEELKRFDNYTGQNKYHYRKVSEECFNHYISYLTTKKTSFLRNAQREIVQ